MMRVVQFCRSVSMLSRVLSTLALIFLVGCNREDRVIRASQRLVGNGRQPPPAKTELVPRYIPAAFYIDASASMAGFPGCERGRSHYDRVLMGLDLALNSDEIRANVALFGGDKNKNAYFVNTSVNNELLCGNAYSFAQNPDSALYARVLADTIHLVSVYVTDAVQSDGTSVTPAATLQVLRQWLARDHSIAILAYRSDFRGRVWSEAADTMFEDQTVAARPFYVVVLAYSETVLAHTLSKLRARATPETEIRLSPNSIQCDFDPEISSSPALQAYRWIYVSRDHYTRRTRDQGTRLGVLSCDVSPDYPVQQIGYRWTVLSRRWGRRNFSPPSPASPTGFSIQVEENTDDGLRAAVYSRVTSRRRGSYGLYTLSLFPEQGTVLRPEIQALSTEDDANPGNFDKTYYFSELVSKLVEIDFERRKVPIQYHFTIQESVR